MLLRTARRRSDGVPSTPAVPGPVVESPLERAMDQLSASGAVAQRVLDEINSPMTTARRVAAVVDLDPVLAAQVMRMANSAAFGAIGTVSTSARAIAMVGLSGVRSLAAARAVSSARQTPPGFWEHSLAAAAGCVAASSAFGVARDEAFSMGLLHDLGWALLHLVDADWYATNAHAAGDGAQQCEAEESRFGIGHDLAAARLLSSWNFPVNVGMAIGAHHPRPTWSPDVSGSAYSHVLAVGDAVALAIASPEADTADLHRVTAALGLSDSAVPDLLRLADEYLAETRCLIT